MAVAKCQIQEILLIVLRYIDPDRLDEFLDDLSKTEAYQRNGSYAETVNRLRLVKPLYDSWILGKKPN